MFDVLIIGGGVIGAMIAREISFYKLNTIVIENNLVLPIYKLRKYYALTRFFRVFYKEVIL